MADTADRPRERRSAQRVATDIPVRVHGGRGEIHCRVVNLSTIGAAAISSHELPEMSEVRIRVRAPEGGTEDPLCVWCDAAVVRCDQRADRAWDLGLFFTGLDAQDQRKLAQIIEIHNAALLSS